MFSFPTRLLSAVLVLSAVLALTAGIACGGRTLDTPPLERSEPEPEPTRPAAAEPPPKAPPPRDPGGMAAPPPTMTDPPVPAPSMPPPVEPEPLPPPVPACPTVSPCGGTPAGNFRLTGLCLTPPYGYYLLANCPRGEASLELEAHYSLSEDHSYTLDKQLVRVRSAPLECRDLLLDCDEPLTCSNRDERCTCTERQSIAEHGTWRIEDSELLMTTDAGDTTVFGYCRNGESLTLESVSDQYTILYELKQVP